MPKRGASEPLEPAQLGAQGWLTMSLDRKRLGTGKGRAEAAGLYRYIGVVNGHLAFAPATADPPVYLERDELVHFNVTGGGS